MSLETLKVGSTVWLMVSHKTAFVPMFITGENKTSWIIGQLWEQRKFPKKCQGKLYTNKDSRGNRDRVFVSKDEVNKYIWVRENSYRIVSCVQACDDYNVLRQIAELVGYKAEESQGL